MASSTSPVGDLARRYAQALFELAEETRALSEVERDLITLQAMTAGSTELQDLLQSPIRAREEQRRAVMAIASGAGLSALTSQFLGTLADNRRLFALPGIIRAFLDDLRRRRGEITAKVIAAQPMTPDQEAQLADAIKGSAGAQVTIEVTVDPSILGGLIVQLGSRLIDASVRTRLDRLHLAMKGIN